MKNKQIFSLIALVLALTFILPSCSKPSDDGDKSSDDIFDDIFKGESASGKLPELYITTDYDYQVTSKTNYTNISLRFALNDRYSEYKNTYTDLDGGSAQLRCRGNSSYGKEDMKLKNKYSYKLRLDSKEDLLGMGESRHWYLLANWFDVTHMRNKLAYDLSGTLGMSYTESTWVVLYYNGEYRGIYSLVESIRIDKGRVETFNWEEYAEDIAAMYTLDNDLDAYGADILAENMKNDLSWITTQKIKLQYTCEITNENGAEEIIRVNKTVDLSKYFDPDKLDLTSGYLIEYDGRLDGDVTKWRTERGIPVSIDSPSALSTNPVMYEYVSTLIQDFENAIYSDTFYNDKGKHYSEYLDVGSLVDFWMIWNLFNNIEFGYLSLYYYIDNGKIVFGPNWDFDNASGNIVTLNNQWMKWNYWVNDRGGQGNGWFKTIMKDPYFVSLCQERWFSMREAIDEMMRSMDVYHEYLGEEALRCYERNGPRVNWYLKNKNGGISYDFETDFKNLKDWLTNRITWIDQNLAKKFPKIDGNGITRSEKIFIVPSVNGKSLENERVCVYGAFADYLIPTDTDTPLTLSITNKHTTASSVSVYFNGKLIGNQSIGLNTPVVFTVDASELRLNEKNVNVAYVIAYKSNGEIRSVSSLNIKASEKGNPQNKEYAVLLQNETVHVKKGESITLPEIKETREGFIALGWTVGDEKVYKSGESFRPEKNTYLYVRWERVDPDSDFIL